jgi:hypothetical protein
MSPNLLINNQIRPPIEFLKPIIQWIFPYFKVSPPWVKILALSLAGADLPEFQSRFQVIKSMELRLLLDPKLPLRKNLMYCELLLSLVDSSGLTSSNRFLHFGTAK